MVGLGFTMDNIVDLIGGRGAEVEAEIRGNEGEMEVGGNRGEADEGV